ncbi:hypothetical protein PVAP13_9NG541400 [Panicum virgatum]|uniref:BHLH domain-containing protein n=1 Tax=Panicum virgatum TaxID=38727 RepID=A0A8T0MZ63_PANVG|nr:hypothetical protein PVAP13_9NG541400 [Panicum virgatum]
MEDYSSLFVQWVTNTLELERPAPAVVDDVCGQATTFFPSPQPLPEASSYADEMVQKLLITGAHAAAISSWSSTDTTHDSGGRVLAPRHQAVEGEGHGPPGDGTPETAAATARGMPEQAAYGSLTPPIRRAGLKSTGSKSSSSAPYTHDHIMAERKRREKIKQLFVELSAVIPGLKKMDKATILSEAMMYVKKLQEKLNAWEAVSGVVLEEPLPEIEVQLSGNDVMVRVLCENGKGVVARVLAEVEDLHLSIVGASVMPSPVCTLSITITAKLEAAFMVTAEEVIDRVGTALSQQQI